MLHMTTYSVTVPDAADSYLQEVAVNLGWDSTKEAFADWFNGYLLSHITKVVEDQKSTDAYVAAAATAQTQADEMRATVQTAFGVTPA